MKKTNKYKTITEKILGAELIMKARCISCSRIWTPYSDCKILILRKDRIRCPGCNHILDYGGEE